MSWRTAACQPPGVIEELRWPHGGHGDCASARAGHGVQRGRRAGGPGIIPSSAVISAACTSFEAPAENGDRRPETGAESKNASHQKVPKSWAGTSAGVGERARQEVAPGVPQQTQPSLCAFGFASLCGRPFGAIGEGTRRRVECLVSTRFQMARHDAHLTSLRF